MRESDEELRKEQEAAEVRMGIDPAEFDSELRQAEAAPWRRGIGWWLTRRKPSPPPPDDQ